MPLKRKFQFLVRYFHNNGLYHSIKLVFTYILNHLHLAEIGYCYLFDCQHLSQSKRLPDNPSIEVRILTNEEAQQLAQNNEPWFFTKAVEDSIKRGDICFAGFINDELAGSCWVSKKPIMQFGRILMFEEDTFIIHRTFVKDKFRRKKVNTTIRKFALKHMASLNYSYKVSTIEWTNMQSVKNAEKLGEKRIGYVIQLLPSTLNKSFLIKLSDFKIQLK